jgi:hypothetical protein
MIGGEINLISTSLARHIPGLHRLNVEGRGEVRVRANVGSLRRQAEKSLGAEIRLAGRRVLP